MLYIELYYKVCSKYKKVKELPGELRVHDFEMCVIASTH